MASNFVCTACTAVAGYSRERGRDMFMRTLEFVDEVAAFTWRKKDIPLRNHEGYLEI